MNFVAEQREPFEILYLGLVPPVVRDQQTLREVL